MHSGLDVSVILPTYKESSSLPVVIPRVAGALAEAGFRFEVIVVDDDSPDGTAEVAEALAAEHPVRVLKRTSERGLATAVLAGFALSEATVCVVMDADGSHPVSALPGMVQLILDDKAEIVVGSRHVPGGGSQDWPLFSQLKSRFAASLAVGLTSMTDPTTGFMAIRRTRLQGLKLDPVGWKIVLETVVKARPVRLGEVPIVFTDREHGESKQSLRVLGQYLAHLWKLYDFRFPGVVEFLKFCLVGLFGLFVDLAMVSLLKQALALDTRLCQVFGFAAAVSFNFAINRRYSFKRASNTPLFYSYVAYVAANLMGLTVRMMAIQLLMRLTELDRGHGYLLLSVFGILLATAVNFVGVKYFAFAPERLTPERDDDSDVERVAEKPRLIGVIALAIASLLLVGVSFAVPRSLGHDEQVNLAMAENIRRGSEGFVHPSVTQGPVAHWQTDALPALGNTPLYPLLLAGALGLGPLGVGMLAVALWAALLLAVGRTLRRDPGAGRAALVLTASSPALVASFGLIEFEPAVATFCALGFLALTRSAGRIPYALLAGAAMGFGFALKMWLTVPAFLAALGYLVSRSYRTQGDEHLRVRRMVVPFVLSALFTAGSHLMYVALVAPEDLRAWLTWVYLGIFSGRGVTGEKLEHAERAAPAFAYLGWLLRDHGALLVPLTLGLPAATRRVVQDRRAIFAAALGALFGLVPLSVPAAKEPLYMLPALPFLYLLSALAVGAADRVPARHARVNRGAARASLVVASLVCFGLVLSWLLGGGALDGLWPLALRLGHVAAWCLPSLAIARGRAATPQVVPAAALSLACAAAPVIARVLIP